jgi:ATP-binding cassette subfamily B protein
LLTTIPLRVLETALQASIAIRAGALLKRRLLAGASRLDPEVVRGEGAGHLLARVLESETFEALALGVGFLAIGASIDVALTAWALSAGPAPLAFLALFAAFVAASIAIARRVARRTSSAVNARLASTHDLVERMTGHRTRLAQEDPARRHVEEDRLLERYVESSRALDRTTLWLTFAVERGWLVCGIALLGATLMSGTAAPAAIAIGLGGVLLGQQALAKLTGGASQLATCVAAWRTVRPLFEAASRPVELGLPEAALAHDSTRTGRTEPATPPRERSLVEARGLSHRYSGRSRSALRDVTVSMRHGERVLVSGPSGGGKSTLASLLIGWRSAREGVLLLDGLDRKSHGDAGWSRRVAAAPQFHENHVFTGSFLFNVSIGASGRTDARNAVSSVRARALDICRELGLGDLLDRMPAGLQQVIGETGWQLSHGERSRLFIARALLQDAELVVLDESLASLDPESFESVLACCLRRSASLILIAHP